MRPSVMIEKILAAFDLYLDEPSDLAVSLTARALGIDESNVRFALAI